MPAFFRAAREELIFLGSFSVELAPPRLPATRHAYLVWLERQHLLTGAFRRWREMPTRTRLDKPRRRQHEQTILFLAGVLAHWAGDLSMPLHCSVHVLGWAPGVPNPHGYNHRRQHSTAP